MVPDNHALLLFRFSEHRWINAIIEGTLSFSCAGNFVEQAMKTDNNIQGDRYEGVFARLGIMDTKIASMRRLLGSDLEEIPDGDYVLLRRKSAMLKPIFCFYGYKAKDALEDCGEIEDFGMHEITHEFDPRMYAGFSEKNWNDSSVPESQRFTMLILQPKPFIDKINSAITRECLSYRMGIVDYEKRGADTFFIPPTDDYDELFCKRPMYSYQYEGRVCLKGMSLNDIHDRYPLKIGTLDERDYKMSHEPLTMVMRANIGDRGALSEEEHEVLIHG